MCVNGRSKFNLQSQRLGRGKVLFFVSLLFVVLLVFSCFVSMFSVVSPFVLGASNIVVSDEAELVAAVNNAPSWVSVVIALDRDITLTKRLDILEGKDIRLISEPEVANFRLVGAFDSDTLSVGYGGVLYLDGICVTHESGYAGHGVFVYIGGTLLMCSGKISDNQSDDGGGVYNMGAFVMSGGAITNNTAGHYGGGVCNWDASFVMSGGEISGNAVSNNTSDSSGGGVYNQNSVFTLSGGKISNNVAKFRGGGVCNQKSNFTMSGGEISDNTVDIMGGGVSNRMAVFIMSGGVISGNRAIFGGGGVFNAGNFTMLGGKISKNSVVHTDSGGGFGGGVYNGGDTFNVFGGVIWGNYASKGGSDVYNYGEVYFFGVRSDVIIVGCVGVVFVVAAMVFIFKKRRRAHVAEKLSIRSIEG
jgi:hypothetical protein